MPKEEEVEVITAAETTELAEIEATELANIEAEMKAEAAAMKENLTVTSSKISNSNKKFTMPDGKEMGDTMELVILGYIDTATYYPGVYNSNKHEAPTCYAFGEVGKPMLPSGKVEKPQAPSCEECANSQFGSKGDGKACNESYQVAVIVPGESDTPVTLTIAATGRGSFNTSMSAIINNFGHPAKAIVTAEFTEKAYPVVKLTGGRPNPDFAKHYSVSKAAVATLLEQG